VQLPRTDDTVAVVDRVATLLADLPTVADDGAALDAVMDEVQMGLAAVNDAVVGAFVRSSG
jgi:hypothetical protein